VTGELGYNKKTRAWKDGEWRDLRAFFDKIRSDAGDGRRRDDDGDEAVERSSVYLHRSFVRSNPLF
jgi:hypothetical protein